MESKINLLLVIIISLTFYDCSGQTKNDNKEIIKVKKFTLCNCLYEILPQKEKVKKNEGSASHFLQSSNLPISVFSESMIFLKEYLKKTEKNYINFYDKPNVAIVRCLDLYESDELDQFIKKALKDIDRE